MGVLQYLAEIIIFLKVLLILFYSKLFKCIFWSKLTADKESLEETGVRYNAGMTALLFVKII